MSRAAAPYLPAAAAAILALAVYTGVALVRMPYPYDLEWMEGGMADHAARVAAGDPLYVAPSIEFTPYIYTPLYYAVGAVAQAVAGPGLAPLRFVSFAAALACFMLIALIVYRETTAFFPALLAAGFYAACFRAGGAWLDLARNDSLFLALLLAGVLALRRSAGIAGSAGAALAVFLAFFTKQTALVAALPLAAWCVVFRSGPARWAFPAALALLVAGSTVAMNGLTDGWYGFYVFDVPSGHGIEAPAVIGFWIDDLGRNVPIAAVATAAWLVLTRRSRAGAAFHLSLQAGLLAASWIGRMHTGGYDNVLLPAFAGLAIGLGLGTHALTQRSTRQLARWGIAAACAAQILWLAYDPRAQVPRPADREAGERLVRLIASIQGEVFIPGRGHLAALAGKRPFAHAMAIDDVFRGDDGAPAEALEESIRASLQRRRFGAILFDEIPSEHRDLLEAGYEHRGRLLADPAVFLPVTGLPVRPEELLVRRP